VVLRSCGARPGSAGEAWYPRIDIFEKGGRLIARVDLPGMKKDDVKVEATDGQLAISGERTRQTEERGEEFYRCEREYGRFVRLVPLPEGVQIDDVKASFADGVLEVSMPLPAPARANVRRIEIADAKTARTAT
jgi:HSP20 family protein